MASGLWCGGCPDAAYFKTLSEASGQSLFSCGASRSFVELFIGWFLAQVFHLRYWDYHDYPLQLGGYICLYSALGFGIAGVLWVCVFARTASHLWRKMPVPLQRIFLTLLILAFLFDCAAALIFPNAGHNITFS